MREKRRYMRFSVILDAICRHGNISKKLKINNFSKEGLGVASEEDMFEKGDNLEIEMMIPGDNIPVLLEGEVAWKNKEVSDTKQYRAGVKFKKISNSDKARILECIYQNWIVTDKTNHEVHKKRRKDEFK